MMRSIHSYVALTLLWTMTVTAHAAEIEISTRSNQKSRFNILTQGSFGYMHRRGQEVIALNKLDSMISALGLGFTYDIPTNPTQRFYVQAQGGAQAAMFRQSFGEAGIWGGAEGGFNFGPAGIYARQALHLSVIRSTTSQATCFDWAGANASHYGNDCDPDHFDPGEDLSLLAPIAFGASLTLGAKVDLIKDHLTLGFEGMAKGWIGGSYVMWSKGVPGFVMAYDLSASGFLQARF
jgi:hypothetical protein